MRFEDVYREHVTPVWRYVRLRVPSDSDAEDVTSQVFEKALRSWPSYDAGRGSVVGWLVGIARHAVADWWRKHGRELPVEEAGADDVRRQLGVLTPREREAVALRFGSELTSAEIGDVLGISATAARMLVHRGVGRLREVMTDG